MGLKDLERDAIEKSTVWYVKDWLRRTRAGEKGPEMQKMVDMIAAHRTEIGAAMASLSVVLEGGYKAHIPHMTSDWVSTIAYILFTLGTTVFGAGKFHSDEYHEEKIQIRNEVAAIEKDDR